MKKLFFVLVLFGLTAASAQKKEELLVLKKEKIKLISNLQTEVDSIQKEIDILPAGVLKLLVRLVVVFRVITIGFQKKHPTHLLVILA